MFSYKDNSSVTVTVAFSKNGTTTASTPTTTPAATVPATTTAPSTDSEDFIDTIQSTVSKHLVLKAPNKPFIDGGGGGVLLFGHIYANLWYQQNEHFKMIRYKNTKHKW